MINNKIHLSRVKWQRVLTLKGTPCYLIGMDEMKSIIKKQESSAHGQENAPARGSIPGGQIPNAVPVVNREIITELSAAPIEVAQSSASSIVSSNNGKQNTQRVRKRSELDSRQIELAKYLDCKEQLSNLLSFNVEQINTDDFSLSCKLTGTERANKVPPQKILDEIESLFRKYPEMMRDVISSYADGADKLLLGQSDFTPDEKTMYLFYKKFQRANSELTIPKIFGSDNFNKFFIHLVKFLGIDTTKSKLFWIIKGEYGGSGSENSQLISFENLNKQYSIANKLKDFKLDDVKWESVKNRIQNKADLSRFMIFLDTSIDDFGTKLNNVRARKALIRLGVHTITIEDLVKRSPKELESIKGCGSATFKYIEEELLNYLDKCISED
jgi:hypothetical protein